MAHIPQHPSLGRGFPEFFRRNLSLILISGLFAAFWMLIYAFAVYKPGYSAQAVVIIRDSALTRRFVEPEQGYALQTTTSSSSNPVLNTMGILKSAAISDALYRYVSTRHPDELSGHGVINKADWERFFGDGSGFITAKNQTGTDLISIRFSWRSPTIAKEALDVVVKAFQSASRDLNREEQVIRTRFLERQAGEIETRLQAVRREKSAYQSRMGAVNTDRESVSLSETRLEISNRLNQVEAWRQGKLAQVSRYENLLGMTPETAVSAVALGQNQSLIRLQDDLYRLRQRYAQERLTWGDTALVTEETRAQIIQTMANIRAEQMRTLGRSPGRRAIAGWHDGGVVGDTARTTLVADMIRTGAEAEDLRAQTWELRRRLADLDERIRTFPQMTETLTEMTQQETSLSLALDQLRQKVLEGHMKEAQTLSNVFVVDPPQLPKRADFPGRSHLVLLSLVTGAAFGLAVAALREEWRRPGKSPDSPGAPSDWLEPLDDDDPGVHEENNPKGGVRKEIAQQTAVRIAEANPSRFNALMTDDRAIRFLPTQPETPSHTVPEKRPATLSETPVATVSERLPGEASLVLRETGLSPETSVSEMTPDTPRPSEGVTKTNPYMDAPEGSLSVALRNALKHDRDRQ